MEKDDVLPGADSTPAPAAFPAAPPVPASISKAPSGWAKQKATPDWILAGAYFQERWERDGAGNDLSLISEDDFDAACAGVASISISAAPSPAQGITLDATAS